MTELIAMWPLLFVGALLAGVAGAAWYNSDQKSYRDGVQGQIDGLRTDVKGGSESVSELESKFEETDRLNEDAFSTVAGRTMTLLRLIRTLTDTTTGIFRLLSNLTERVATIEKTLNISPCKLGVAAPAAQTKTPNAASSLSSLLSSILGAGDTESQGLAGPLDGLSIDALKKDPRYKVHELTPADIDEFLANPTGFIEKLRNSTTEETSPTTNTEATPEPYKLPAPDGCTGDNSCCGNRCE